MTATNVSSTAERPPSSVTLKRNWYNPSINPLTVHFDLSRLTKIASLGPLKRQSENLNMKYRRVSPF